MEHRDHSRNYYYHNYDSHISMLNILLSLDQSDVEYTSQIFLIPT